RCATPFLTEFIIPHSDLDGGNNHSQQPKLDVTGRTHLDEHLQHDTVSDMLVGEFLLDGSCLSCGLAPAKRLVMAGKHSSFIR
ncbi:MAG: hypothetical protein OSB69_13525, partial [Alphaproteobacteria bacterium]|nr:hypothetical protein [Alphaproteobacteria bacterium]